MHLRLNGPYGAYAPGDIENDFEMVCQKLEEDLQHFRRTSRRSFDGKAAVCSVEPARPEPDRLSIFQRMPESRGGGCSFCGSRLSKGEGIQVKTGLVACRCCHGMMKMHEMIV